MSGTWPDYVTVPRERLGEGTGVAVEVVADAAALARHMAEAMLGRIQRCAEAGKAATMIVPVGPVDQYPILAQMVNEQQVDLREVMMIQMDEYLTDEDAWVGADHPLSFRGFLARKFYDLVDEKLAPRLENRVAPRPEDVEQVGRRIAERGGVDVCFGGIGINGHMAFNEPPEPGQAVADEAFADLPTRVLSLSRETRTINANTVGGEISIIPRRAVTVGMREILGAEQVRFYCNRPWQSAVVRRVLHGPVGAACPASFLRTHGDARLCVTEEVASVPDIRLR